MMHMFRTLLFIYSNTSCSNRVIHAHTYERDALFHTFTLLPYVL